MNRDQIIRLSGWALILGGLAIALGFLLGEEGIFFGLFLLAPVLLGFGMLGLRARYGDEMGGLGKGVLVVGVIGAAIALVGAIGQILGDDGFFLGTFVGLTLMFAGLLLFGAVAVPRSLLPRWNWLPVLAGIWVPMIALLYAISEGLGVRLVDIPDAALVVGFVIVGVAVSLLGYVLQADAAGVAATA